MSSRNVDGYRKTDEAKRTFMRGVAKDLCWMDEEASKVSVEQIIYSHGRWD